MIITKLELKNVFSYGTELQTIEFNKSSLIRLFGPNGAGKSSLKDTMIFGLYGKIEGLTISDIANDTNPDGFIAIHYNIGENRYVNRWNFNPNKLSIELNDEILDLGGLTLTKKHLLNEIIDIPYDVFSNIISINVSSFKSFLNMSPTESRAITDRVFGFTLINKLYEQAKITNNELVKSHGSVKTRLTVMEESISNLVSEFEIGKTERLGLIKTKTDELNGLIKSKRLEYKTMSDKLKVHGASKLNLESNLEFIKFMELKMYKQVGVKKSKSLKIELDGKNQELLDASYKKSVLDLNKSYYTNESLIVGMNEAEKSIPILQESYKELESEIEMLGIRLRQTKESVDWWRKFEAYQEHKVRVERIEAIKNELPGLIEGKDLLSDDDTSELKETINELNIEISKLEDSIKLHEQGVCPTCGSDLTAEHLGDYKADLAYKIGAVHEANSELAKMEESNAIIANRFNKVVDSIKILEYELETLEKFDSAEKPTPIQTIVGESESEAIKILEERNSRYANRTTELKDVISNIYAHQNTIEASRTVDSSITKPTSSEFEIDLELKTTIDLISKLKSDISALEESIFQMNSKVARITAKIELYPDEMVSPDDAKGITNKQGIDEYKSRTISLIRETELEIESIKRFLEQIKSDGISLAEQLKMVNNSYEAFTKPMEKLIADATSKRDELYETSKKSIIKIDVTKSVCHILGEKGVKSFMLRAVIPFMNKETNRVLQKFDLKFEINFDENFTPSIIRNGKSVNVRGISTGQTKMANLSILIALTKVLNMRYKSIGGVIFYDELLSTIDKNRTPKAIEVIKEEVCSMGLAVIVVDHSISHDQLFDGSIEVKQIQGFSKLEFN